MLKWLEKKWNSYQKERAKKFCNTCGERIHRTQWGGRVHYTKKGQWYLHPIDYILTMNSQSHEESKRIMEEYEEVGRFLKGFKAEHPLYPLDKTQE